MISIWELVVMLYNQLVYGSGLYQPIFPTFWMPGKRQKLISAGVDSSWLDRWTFVELRISQYLSSMAVLGDIAMSMAISTTA